MTPFINHTYIDFMKAECLNTHMHKIACLFSFRESSWISCQKIVFNLHKAYEGLTDSTILNFDYGSENLKKLPAVAEKIFESEPSVIVFMDHLPHPVSILKHLLPKYENKSKPLIVFHVFGDFSLYYEYWSTLEPLLIGFPVKFVVASERQKIFIDNFLPISHASVVCPFPVNPEEFKFSSIERKSQRDNWGVSDDEIVFTFTGRISRQKRIHLLLKAFAEALHQDPSSKARLFIYGQADHVGDNFLQIWEAENEYFRKVHRCFMALPETARSRIHFMGNVPNSELSSVYNGADYLLNLSVHNDEDFGMSVAEAQFCGLPSILSDWGGLASFNHTKMPEATRFIKVSLGTRSKVVSIKETISALKEAIGSQSSIDRKKLSESARARFSINAAATILRDIYSVSPVSFTAFNEILRKIANKQTLRQDVYVTRTKQISPTYRRLYSAYVRPSQ